PQCDGSGKSAHIIERPSSHGVRLAVEQAHDVESISWPEQPECELMAVPRIRPNDLDPAIQHQSKASSGLRWRHDLPSFWTCLLGQRTGNNSDRIWVNALEKRALGDRADSNHEE